MKGRLVKNEKRKVSIKTSSNFNEHKKIEEKLKIFMKIFETSPNSQYAVDYKKNEPHIIDVNSAFLDYYGCTKKEVLGQNPRIIKSGKHDKHYYQKMWKVILDPKIGFWRDEIVNKRKDGSFINVMLTISTIFDERKKPIYFVASHMNITARKKAEDLLKEQNKDLIRKTIELNELKGKLEDKNYELESAFKNLNKQNKDLIRKTMALTELQGQLDDKNYELQKANMEILRLMEARTEFMNKAAHDLRTPITPILLLIPSIKKRIKDIGILYDIKVIEKNANYLKQIADDLISYLKSSTGQYTYVFKKTDIKDLIEDVLATYGEAFNQSRISIIRKIPSNLPLVELDEITITEVLQNLASNALKFMPKVGKLTIYAEKKDNFIKVRFKDTGIGMSKKTLSKIFAEFFKADESRHTSGEGLGLSICKRIIEDHHGRIWAESKGIGKGSTILFDIPISQKVMLHEEER